MAGCFGGGMFDKHFETQLNNYLDSSEHHPRCECSDEDETFNEDGTPYEKTCTCDEEYADDEAEAKLSRMDF